METVTLKPSISIAFNSNCLFSVSVSRVTDLPTQDTLIGTPQERKPDSPSPFSKEPHVCTRAKVPKTCDGQGAASSFTVLRLMDWTDSHASARADADMVQNYRPKEVPKDNGPFLNCTCTCSGFGVALFSSDPLSQRVLYNWMQDHDVEVRTHSASKNSVAECVPASESAGSQSKLSPNGL